MLEQKIIEQLFRQNYSKMIHLASVLLGERHQADVHRPDMGGEAEDVVQDIFLRIAAGDIPPKNDNYLLVAVRNACLNRIRNKQLQERVRKLLPIDADADIQPIEKQRERLEDIAAYVDERLEEPHRSIFHLRFDDDLTITEIARRLGLNPNTTYKYLAQSLERIRQHFNNH